MSDVTDLLSRESSGQRKARLRRVAGATIIGSMLEWYDFYLYAMMAATVFAKVFFDPREALQNSQLSPPLAH
ncbi:hypothetical protein BVY10_19100 [Pseudomonas amygdali pv. morsprunorum]|nr:hypothetical protein BVY10_19100 [Pseudomonas amygdali pv. morsprunorum]